MKFTLKHIVLSILLVAYVATMVSGHFATMKKVLYSTSAPSSIERGNTSPKPFAVHSLCSSQNQIVSSYKIVVPDDGLPTEFYYEPVSDFITILFVVHLPENLQPLSFPSKPRDPPVA